MLPNASRVVWVFFKLLELAMTLACCIVHGSCASLMSNRIPDIFVLCAAYGGGCIIVVLSLIGLLFSSELSLSMEASVTGLVGTMHLFSVFAHMYLVQFDAQLPFLRDVEKSKNAYYKCCQTSAHLALYAVGIYYLHFFLVLDLILTRVNMPGSIEHPQLSKRPLRLYFISSGVQLYLSRYRWFNFMVKLMEGNFTIRRFKTENLILNTLSGKS